jgi:hypothetical protein
VDVELADLVRVLIWPGILYLIVRMGYRGATRECSTDLMLARAALCVLFISRALTMAQHWHQPLNWASAPATIIAMALVWRSRII